MKTFEIGILGCGMISRTYCADIKRFFPCLHLAACADADAASAKKLASKFDIPKAVSTEELLQDQKIEIVINLTPPQFHVELNRKIILAGKHLFSEKPFAPSVEDARDVLELAERHRVRVGCAPDTFLASGLQSVRHYLDCGIIGRPFMVTANMTTFGVETWHPNPKPFYGENSGPLFDMGPYYVSAIVSLLGAVDRVSAFSARPNPKRYVYAGALQGQEIPSEADTSFTAILCLHQGVIVNLNLSYDIYKSDLPMLEIFGDGGTLTYPDPNFGGGTPKVYRKEQFTDPIYQDTEAARERQQKFYELPELFPRVKDYSRGIGVLDLADAIETGRENRANGALILHVTEVLNGIREASVSGEVVKMKTTCVRPAALTPGGVIDRVS